MSFSSNGEGKRLLSVTGEVMTYDEVIDHIGGWGWYQKVIVSLCSYVWAAQAFITMHSVFTARPVDQVCVIDAVSYPEEDNTLCNSTSICWSSMKTGYDDDFGVHKSVVSEFDLVCGDDYLASLIGPAYFVGFFIGCGVFGTYADRVGRRRALLHSGWIIIGGQLLCALTPTYAGYMVGRFTAGFGIGGQGTPAWVLPMEFISEEYRSIVGSAVLNTVWAVGACLTVVFAYVVDEIYKNNEWDEGFASWRTFSLVCLLLIVIAQVLSAIAVYESPRYLAVNVSCEEAVDVLRQVGKHNDVHLPPIKLDIPQQNEGPKASIKDLFTSNQHLGAPLRRTTGAMLAMWFTVSFVFYGLNFNVGSLEGDLYVNALMVTAADIPANLSTSYILDRVGRVYPIAASILLGGFGCAGVVLMNLVAEPDCGDSDDSSLWCAAKVSELMFAFVGKFGIAFAFSALFPQAGEVFPTVLRSAGMAMLSQAARIGAITATGVLALNSVAKSIPFACFAVFALLTGFVSLFVPETLGIEYSDTFDAPPRASRSSRFHSRGSGSADEYSFSVRSSAEDRRTPLLSAVDE
eukprot:Rmarinus@m.28864